LKILTKGQWETPILIAVKDDRSRLICHMQWFRGTERSEIVAHCLMQAFQKRGLPRSTICDNGGAMVAAEIVEGFGRLGIKHERTLPYSAYQNGKSESVWSSVEGRLLAMLEGVEGLALELLNEASQAWVELEYNRRINDDTGEAPLNRFLAGPSVLRPAPDSDALRLAFTRTVTRTPRKSDGTVPVAGHRFEIPSRYRHLTQVEIRYASWNLNEVHLVDERTGHVLCRLFPQDKAANASGLRRPLEPIAKQPIIAASSRPTSLSLAALSRLRAAWISCSEAFLAYLAAVFGMSLLRGAANITQRWRLSLRSSGSRRPWRGKSVTVIFDRRARSPLTAACPQTDASVLDGG
jgi:hypothetical protein